MTASKHYHGGSTADAQTTTPSETPTIWVASSFDGGYKGSGYTNGGNTKGDEADSSVQALTRMFGPGLQLRRATNTSGVKAFGIEFPDGTELNFDLLPPIDFNSLKSGQSVVVLSRSSAYDPSEHVRHCLIAKEGDRAYLKHGVSVKASKPGSLVVKSDDGNFTRMLNNRSICDGARTEIVNGATWSRVGPDMFPAPATGSGTPSTDAPPSYGNSCENPEEGCVVCDGKSVDD